mgnify:CR=1 FL=1|tara:strand:+ start:434 stop:673 length:240 start_codon:yes stop_codon:yes gene_type:complete
MTFKQKYNQDFVDKIHSMKNQMSKSEIAKKLNVAVTTVNYILDKREPSLKVKYETVEKATNKIDKIWKRIKKRFPFKPK